MERIKSFDINHDILTKGLYISRIDGDIVTYDIRVKVPNGGDYLTSPSMHTIEHIFATFVRNSILKESVIYFGPMGCRTGFYLLLRDAVNYENALKLVKDSFKFIADFKGEIPGSKREECGNYLEHDLPLAKTEALKMCEVLENWNTKKMNYLG